MNVGLLAGPLYRRGHIEGHGSGQPGLIICCTNQEAGHWKSSQQLIVVWVSSVTCLHYTIVLGWQSHSWLNTSVSAGVPKCNPYLLNDTIPPLEVELSVTTKSTKSYTQYVVWKSRLFSDYSETAKGWRLGVVGCGGGGVGWEAWGGGMCGGAGGRGWSCLVCFVECRLIIFFTCTTIIL